MMTDKMWQNFSKIGFLGSLKINVTFIFSSKKIVQNLEIFSDNVFVPNQDFSENCATSNKFVK